MYKTRPIEVAIDVPSGHIVCANDLRFAYPIPDEEDFAQSVNGPLWQKTVTEAYAKVGLLHGYVGNSCPNIYKHGNTIIIGNPLYNETDSIECDIPGNKAGSITTDLWWYSVADRDDFIQLIKSSDKDVDKEMSSLDAIIKVQPGRYVLKHYYPHFGHTAQKYELFATLQRSDKKIKPHNLPDEGIAAMLSSRFEHLSYVCVEADKDKYDEMSKDASLIFKYYQIMMHWKFPDLGDIFSHPKFTGDELLNHELVIQRATTERDIAVNDQLAHNKSMEEHAERLSKMSPEEREAHDKGMKDMFEELLKEIDGG